MTDPFTVLRASHERLQAAVAPLNADQLSQPAYPSEWSIAQVVAHVGSGAEIMGLAVAAGLNGEEGPARDLYPPIWDRWNAKTPEAMGTDGVASDARLVEQVEALRAHPETRVATWAGPMDPTGVAALRVFEHAVHTWDVIVALDPTAQLAPDAVALMIPGLGQLVGFGAKPNGREARIHVVTADPGYEFALTLGEKSSLEPWDGGNATARLRLPAEAFVRLLYGRLDADHCPPVEIEGITLDDLRATFPGF